MRRIWNRGWLVVVSLAAAVPAAVPAHAQVQVVDELQPPRAFFGIQGLYANPVGEFGLYVEYGGGLNASAVLPIRTSSPLALRADGGFIVYGSETQRVCFSGTVGCRVQLDLTTTNSIGYLSIGPQLMLPSGPVRPYAGAGVGLSYFGTSSSVEGTRDSEDIASTTNFDDFTLAWNGGGGVLVALSRGATPFFLDLGVRYTGNGEVEYLKKGDIVDTPTGITFTPTRSQANLVSFMVGVTIGARPGLPRQ